MLHPDTSDFNFLRTRSLIPRNSLVVVVVIVIDDDMDITWPVSHLVTPEILNIAEARKSSKFLTHLSWFCIQYLMNIRHFAAKKLMVTVSMS